MMTKEDLKDVAVGMLIGSIMMNIFLGVDVVRTNNYAESLEYKIAKQKEELASYRAEEKADNHIYQTLLEGYKVKGVNTEALVDYISDAAMQYHVDPKLIMAQISAESSFKTSAVSIVGARGLMQIMPFWIKNEEFRQATGIFHPDQLYNPRKNIMAGTYILAHYIDKCGSIRKGLACYHGGFRAIHNPRPVTTLYVNKVMKRYLTI